MAAAIALAAAAGCGKGTAGSANAPAPAPSPAAAPDVAATASALRAARVEEGAETDVPQGVRTLLPMLKAGLLGVYREVLSGPEGLSDAPEDLVAALVAGLERHGIRLGRTEPGSGYGDVVDVGATVPRSDLLVVESTVSLPCEDESSLYLFRRSGDGWQHVASLDSPPYASLRDAYGSLGWLALPPSGGSFPLVVTRVTPWCTSAWRELTLSVHRVGPDGALTQLHTSSYPVYLGGDEPSLEAEDGGFSLKFEGHAPEGSDDVSEKKELRFRVDAGVVLVRARGTGLPPAGTSGPRER